MSQAVKGVPVLRRWVMFGVAPPPGRDLHCPWTRGGDGSPLSAAPAQEGPHGGSPGRGGWPGLGLLPAPTCDAVPGRLLGQLWAGSDPARVEGLVGLVSGEWGASLMGQERADRDWPVCPGGGSEVGGWCVGVEKPGQGGGEGEAAPSGALGPDLGATGGPMPT